MAVQQARNRLAVVLSVDQQAPTQSERLSHPPKSGKLFGLGPVKYHLVSAISHELSNGLLSNSNARRDLTIGMSLEIEIVDQLP
jgi:hypothetical protein